jgi:hypothetical protein
VQTLFGGNCEAALLSDGDEIAKMPELHMTLHTF